MKILRQTFLFILTLLLIPVIFAQNGSGSQSLGKGINSDYAEINPVLSPDGKKLYFVRINHPENNYGEEDSQDIWFSELQPNGTWSDARHMEYPFNTAKYNAVLSISEDGNTILLNGIYNKKDKWIHRGLSLSHKTDNGWSIPEKVKVPAYTRKNKGISSNAFLSSDGQVLLLSYTRKFNGKNLNIYFSKKEDGRWTKPRRLPKVVNTKRSEEAPFLSADGKTLYFSTNREKDKGDFDIYFSTPLDPSWKTWSEPKRLSDTTNTAGWESFFRTNSKGSWAYFASTSKTGSGEADIFRVKLFEENPFVVIHGNVLDGRTSHPLSKEQAFKIYANDHPVDSIRTDSSGKYVIRLPLGKVYTLKAVTENYTSRTEEINVKNIHEQTELNKDLLVDPLPYVIVEGTLLVSGSNAIIPDTAAPRVFLDNAAVDSAIVDLKEGKYRFKIPYGKKHVAEVHAHGFKTVPQTLDLSAIHEFKKIEKALYVELPVVERSNSIVITGKVIDVRTNKPLDPSISFEIRVNDVASSAAVINREASSFSLTLAAGSKYSINASAANYYPVYEIVDLATEKPAGNIVKDLPVAPIVVGQSVKLNNILFETGKAVLKKSSFAELDKVARFLKDNPTIKIEINGHTDNVGDADANQKLSHNRAVAVANYIILSGIPKERIQSKGFGMTKPVASNKTAQGRGLNRRVEFTILDK